MSTVLSVELPEEIMEFVQHQAADLGLDDAGEYVRRLIADARVEHARARIAAALDEGLASPIVAMGEAEWEELRRHVRKHSQNGKQS
jgi:hypothetical protein